MADNGGFPGSIPPVVLGQPAAYSSSAPGEDGGPVQVRNMGPEDAEFAATMNVEGFRDKFEWAVGKDKMGAALRGQIEDHRHMHSDYHRMFIALYQGERAGLLVLKYHDSKEPSVDSAAYSGLGCCGWLGFIKLGCATDEKVPSGKCYVDHIAVDGKFRGKGVGQVLMNRADYEANKQGCKSIYLVVASTNRAKHLYDRQGYKVVSEVGGCCMHWATGIREFYRMEKPL